MRERSSLKKKIYDEILNGIIDGTFPIDKFLNEGELTERFHVSRAPIREALIELCNENILKSIPRLGYQIVQLTEKNLKEATEMRYIIEITGLQKVIADMGDDILASISDLNKEIEQSRAGKTITIDEHWEYNIRFHLLINSFAGNSYMHQVLKDTLKLIRRAYVQLYSEKAHDLYISKDLGRHLEIEKALREGKYENALDILKEDILFIRGRLFIASDDLFVS